MALKSRLTNYVQSHDKLATALLTLSSAFTTLLIETAGVSGNGGP